MGAQTWETVLHGGKPWSLARSLFLPYIFYSAVFNSTPKLG